MSEDKSEMLLRIALVVLYRWGLYFLTVLSEIYQVRLGSMCASTVGT